jgi:RNA polymerase sigma-70 factor (ECF subfamily)
VKFIWRFAKNAADLDDLVQDTLAKGRKNLDKLYVYTNLRSWLYAILRKHRYSRYQRSKPAALNPDAACSAKLAVEPSRE